MTIYTFRCVRSKEEQMYYQESLGDKYPLYAFTTKKKFAKKFERQRDMEKFICIKIERSGKAADQWLDCHRSKKIDMYKLETYVNKNTDDQDVKKARVLATDSEITYLMETIEHGGIFNRLIKGTGFIPIDIFNKKLREILSYLSYDDACKYKREAVMPLLDDIEECDVDVIHNIESNFFIQDFAQNITIDQLGAFILINNDILSQNFYIDTKIE